MDGSGCRVRSRRINVGRAWNTCRQRVRGMLCTYHCLYTTNYHAHFKKIPSGEEKY